MARWMVLAAFLAISCPIAAGVLDQKSQETPAGVEKVQNSTEARLELPAEQITGSSVNVTKSSSDGAKKEGEVIEGPAKARSSVDGPIQDDKPAASTEYDMSTSELFELARKGYEKLHQEQRLVEQKLNGRDIFKEIPKLDQVKNVEDLIKYIVSLAVPNVLKALLPQVKKGSGYSSESGTSRSSHELAAPDDELSTVGRRPKSWHRSRDFPRGSSSKKLASIDEGREEEESRGPQPEAKVRKAAEAKNKRLKKKVGARSRGRNLPQQSSEAQSEIESERSPSSSKGVKLFQARKRFSRRQGSRRRAMSEDALVRRTKNKKVSRRLESKRRSQQVTKNLLRMED